MRDPTISRNYAEALLALARKANDLDGWGGMLQDVASAIERDETLRTFLSTPRLGAAEKNEILGRAFQDRMPRLFVRFLQSLVKNRRQMLIPQIAVEYQNLLDENANRVHATVTMATEPAADETARLTTRLSEAFGKQVVPHVVVNPAILGGVVVRVGDTVLDGSVRRRLGALRARMLRGAPAA